MDLSPDLGEAPSELAPDPTAPATPRAVAPAPAAAGFDFGFAAPPPAATAPALGVDFGFSPAPVSPAAPAPDFGFASASPADPPAAATGFDFAAPDADLAPAGEGGDDNLLGLGGDDIDAMLDGIMRDVGGDQASTDRGSLESADTHIPLFSHLAVDEYVEVLKLLSWRIVKAGEAVVRQGDPGHSMFIISSGRVEAAVDKGGRRQVISTLKDGDFFGEMALLAGGARSATVTALEGTELLELERDKLDQIFSRYPEIEAKLRLAAEERSAKLS